MIAYEDQDEPEEFDDEVRDSVSGEEGEEETEDILIVEAEENYPDDSSPEVVVAKSKPLRDEDSGSDSSVHTDVDTRLYGGDIYLLGGHHYIRDNDSSASTATTAFGLNELSAKATLKKKSASRKRRTTGKGNRVLKGITNSILEEDEDKKTDYGDGYSSMTNLKKDQSDLTPINKSP